MPLSSFSFAAETDSRISGLIIPENSGLLSNVPIDKVHEFENQYLNLLEVKHKDILDQLKQGQVSDEIKSVLKEEATLLSTNFQQ